MCIERAYCLVETHRRRSRFLELLFSSVIRIQLLRHPPQPEFLWLDSHSSSISLFHSIVTMANKQNKKPVSFDEIIQSGNHFATPL